MTRSLRGRSRLYKPTAPRAVYQRRSVVTRPTLPTDGFWTELTPWNWSTTPSPSFQELRQSGDIIVMTDNFYIIQYSLAAGTWTRGNDIDDDFPAFNGAGGFTCDLCVLPDGRFAYPSPFEFVFPNYVDPTCSRPSTRSNGKPSCGSLKAAS